MKTTVEVQGEEPKTSLRFVSGPYGAEVEIVIQREHGAMRICVPAHELRSAVAAVTK